VGVASAVQLSTYDQTKKIILATGLFKDNIYGHLASSLVSGVAVTVFMNPLDVVSTRLYNQKQGTLYSSPLDCINKIARTEGIMGLYKGCLAQYLRLAPHTMLTFIFWEQLKALSNRIRMRQLEDRYPRVKYENDV